MLNKKGYKQKSKTVGIRWKHAEYHLDFIKYENRQKKYPITLKKPYSSGKIKKKKYIRDKIISQKGGALIREDKILIFILKRYTVFTHE